MVPFFAQAFRETLFHGVDTVVENERLIGWCQGDVSTFVMRTGDDSLVSELIVPELMQWVTEEKWAAAEHTGLGVPMREPLSPSVPNYRGRKWLAELYTWRQEKNSQSARIIVPQKPFWVPIIITTPIICSFSWILINFSTKWTRIMPHLLLDPHHAYL